MKTKKLFMLAFFSFALNFIFAGPDSIKGLTEFTLDNGLKVFVAENHTVPLTYIEIAVRSGAIDQSPQTAGLFHLYEHMMFKGNALYKDAASVKKAMSDLGVTQWNGTTGINRVNYFFTVPSDRLEEGLAFWNAAIRFPLMDKTELENEKKVVLAEIEGEQASASKQFFDYYITNFFKDAPYRLDAGGSFDAVRNATVEDLLAIKNKYYIPSNAALFIGGDVDPVKVKSLVEKIFATWTDYKFDKKNISMQQSVNPFDEMKKVVVSYDNLSSQLVQYQMIFRGPDTDFELEDTYAADYLLNLLDKPSSFYVQTLLNDKELLIPGAEYISSSYQTSRANGAYDFSAVSYTPQSNIAENAEYFSDLILKKVLPYFASEKSLYSKKQVKEIAEKLSDERLLNEETAQGILNSLSFWWSNASSDYYYEYSKNIEKVSAKDVKNFIEKYFYKRNPMLVVFVNPEVYEKEKLSFEKAGFEKADGKNSIWWKDSRFSSINSKDIFTEYKNIEEVYVPEKNKSLEKKVEAHKIKIKKLKNGIPVYFAEDSNSSCISLNLGLKGGVEHLTKETSGLESALLSLLSSSSKKYSNYDRNLLSYKTKASITNASYMTGSVISMNCLLKYFDEVFEVYEDSILNPDFNEEEYKKLYTNYKNSIHQESVEPSSLLFKRINDYMFASHPYDTRTYVTDFSIENITVENIKSLYSKIIVPENIFFLINGDVNQNKIIKKLNKTFGKLKVSENKNINYIDEVKALEIKKEENFVIPFENAKGTAYVARVFVSPANVSEDYAAASLVSSIYNDQLFNSVRIAKSVCYTPSSSIIGSKAPYGMEYLFKVSDFKGFKKALDEARSYMEKGLVITGFENNEYTLLPLSEVLESYKNKFINSTFHQKQTPSSASCELVYNILQYDDVEHSDKFIEEIRNLSAEKVTEVFKKYWSSSNAAYFVVCDPDEEKVIKEVLGVKD